MWRSWGFPTTAAVDSRNELNLDRMRTGSSSAETMTPIVWLWHLLSYARVWWAGTKNALYRLLSDESVVGELFPDESAGRDVDRVLYELQWLHLCPITWKFTSETLLQSLQSTQIWQVFSTKKKCIA
jgi:hypothetical protein